LQHESALLGSPKVLDAAADELVDNVVVLEADRYYHVLGDDDAERHSDKLHLDVLIVEPGGLQDDERRRALRLGTGALVEVEGVLEELDRYLIRFAEHEYLVLGGGHKIYPASFDISVHHFEIVVNCLENAYHVLHPLPAAMIGM
jgi:hypothetical protein